MDECLKVFIEESFDNIQSSEEALIRLENKYSKDDINIIFRSAHTLKGSSASMDFNEIASITHKIEDLLDCIRKEEIKIDKFIINLCFKGFDIVGKLIELISVNKHAQMSDLNDSIIEIENAIEELLKKDNNENIINDDKNVNQDILSFSKTYYGYFIFDKKSLMLAARRFLIFTSIQEAGVILYSEPSEEFMLDIGSIDETNRYQCLFKSNKDVNELDEIFNMDEVELANIIDISGNVLEKEYIGVGENDIDFFSFLFENLNKISKIIFIDRDIEKNIDSIKIWLYEFLEKCMNSIKIRDNTRQLIIYKETIYTYVKILLMYLENEICLSDDTIAILQKQYIDLWNQMFSLVENKLIFKSKRILNISNMETMFQYSKILDCKKFKYFLLDISMLEIIEHKDIENLIKLKRELKKKSVEFCLINNGVYRRRYYYIFESIEEIETMKLFYSKIEAIMGFNWKNKRKYLKLEEYRNDKRKL